ncbi:MAG: DUF3108 domain-containing protein [Gammaproteobacteria bacterium]|nr:DUF3108 domain-containing protein [Gammaproteobacteria bacterium]
MKNLTILYVWILYVWLITSLLATNQVPAAEPALAPFSVNFEVIFRGMKAGTASLELTPEIGGRWRYISRNRIRDIFRFAFPGEIQQVSLFTLENAQVKPLQFNADDGTDAKDRDIQLQFDWDAGRVRGVAEKARVDLPIEVNLQDGMSVQVALMQALARGDNPTGYRLIDKGEVKEYVYISEKPVRLRTSVGELDTVVWSSHRPNSSRLTRVWYAPALGYLPVQAERRKGDKVEWSMHLKSYRR